MVEITAEEEMPANVPLMMSELTGAINPAATHVVDNRSKALARSFARSLAINVRRLSSFLRKSASDIITPPLRPETA